MERTESPKRLEGEKRGGGGDGTDGWREIEVGVWDAEEPQLVQSPTQGSPCSRCLGATT